MGASSLGSRAIIGSFYNALEQSKVAWVDQIGMLFNSDQSSETYKWLGQVPAMREWIGGRNPKGFNENGITIENKVFEATLEVLVDEIRRDKTGQVMVRVNDLARRTQSHWASLLSTLIENGTTTVCYDGQYFFDTDHTEGNNSTSQSNDISVDISALAVANHGSVTAPSPEEAAQSVLQGIQQIFSFKDNENEPINEDAQSFMVMVPTSLWSIFNEALKNPYFGGGATNSLTNTGLNIGLVTNPRLTWTDEFAVFRTDAETKPFILQEEKGVTVSAIAEGSELEFTKRVHQYGVEAIRNVGYGMWQHACLVTMI